MNNLAQIDEIEDRYPLSPLQEGMLFDALRNPRLGIDIEQSVVSFFEPLDISALLSAWRLIASRHAVLRTRLRWMDAGEPRQEVQDSIELLWSELDWRGMSHVEQRLHMAEFLKRDRETGIELGRAPMWRLTFMRLDQQEYRMVWTYHHTLLDGRSARTIIREVFAYYDSRSSNQAPPPPTPFRDYVGWLKKQDTRLAEPYWRDALHGFDAPTPLVIDHAPEPDSNSEAIAGHCEVSIPKEVSTAITSFAQEHDLTLNTLILGAWALLISRYSGEPDVAFGVTRSCRGTTIPGADSIVGLLINTLPLRIGADPGAALLPWLKGVRARWSSMRDHEHTPLAKVQAWSDVPTGTPLFKSIVTFQRETMEGELRRMSGAWATRTIKSVHLPNYPLNLSTYGGAEILLWLTFNAHRIDESAAVRMLGHLRSLLEGMAYNPQAKLGELPLLTAAERQQALLEWNQTATHFAAQGALSELFEAQAERTPDAIALESAEGSLTYRALNQRANKLAWHLRQRGVGRDVLVAVCAERSLEMIVGLLAVMKAGGAYVPIDPNHPRERVAFVLRDAGARVILVQDSARGALPDLSAFEVISLSGDWISSENDANLGPIADAASLAYVIYTSGSTGQPKGALVPHGAIANLVLWMQNAFPLDGRDCVLQQTEISFDASVWEIFGPLIAGARLLLAPCGPKDPVGLSNLIAENAVTVIQVVPSLLRALLDTPDFRRCTGLRHVFCGGEAMGDDIPQKLFSALSAELHNLYGPTECAVNSLYYSVPRDSAQRPLPIGHPPANVQAYVLDQHRQPTPIGVPGELYIGGVQLARGYHERPEMNAERFVSDPFSGEAGARLFRTGDKVRRLPNGELVFLGRTDNQIKLRGFRIELGEVEYALEQHPLVAQSVVLLRENASGDQWLAAYVEATGKEHASVSELRDHLRHKLPAHMIPAVFVTLDALPLTSNGKLDRQALLRMDAVKPDTQESHCAPRAVLEIQIAAIWSEVLGVENIRLHDSFFDLGGHSLLALRMISAVNTRLGVSIGIPELYQNPTLDQFAARISIQQGMRGGVPSIVEIKRGESWLPTYFVEAGPREFQQAQVMEGRPMFALKRPWPKAWLEAALHNKTSDLPSMDEMIAPYVKELCAHAGSGPCVLVGHSFTGLVAFELAHQFQLRGGQAPFVLLFDTIAKRPSAARVAWHRVRQDWERNNSLPASARLKSSISLSLEIIKEKSANRMKTWARLSSKAANEDLGALTSTTDEYGVAQPWGLVNRVYHAIGKSYRPRRLRSRGVLFTAGKEDKDWRAIDKWLGWKGLFTEGLEVVELEGDHLSIFGPEQPSPAFAHALNQVLRGLPGYKLD